MEQSLIWRGWLYYEIVFNFSCIIHKSAQALQSWEYIFLGGGEGGCSPRFPIAVHSNYLTHGSPHSLEALSVLTGHVTMYTRMYNVLNVVHVSVCTQSMVKGQRSRMCSRVTLSHNVVCHVLELWLHCLNINQKWFSWHKLCGAGSCVSCYLCLSPLTDCPSVPLHWRSGANR